MGASNDFIEGLRRVAHGAYRPADDRGSLAEGQFRLGLRLERSDNLPAAEAAYRRADEAGHPAAACNLGVLLEGRGEHGDAEAAYRRAANRGMQRRIQSRPSAGRAQRPRGRERAYQHADRLGHAAAPGNLGVLLAEQGRADAAEAAFQRAIERGDPNAADNLRRCERRRRCRQRTGASPPATRPLAAAPTPAAWRSRRASDVPGRADATRCSRWTPRSCSPRCSRSPLASSS